MKRTGGDSNPRYGYPYTAFPVLHHQPLGHLSDDGIESRPHSIGATTGGHERAGAWVVSGCPMVPFGVLEGGPCGLGVGIDDCLPESVEGPDAEGSADCGLPAGEAYGGSDEDIGGPVCPEEDTAEGDEDGEGGGKPAQAWLHDGEEGAEHDGEGGVARGHGPEVGGDGGAEFPGVPDAGGFTEGVGTEGPEEDGGVVELWSGAADEDLEAEGDSPGEA